MSLQVLLEVERMAGLRHSSRPGSEQVLTLDDRTEDGSADRSDGSELHHTSYSKRDASPKKDTDKVRYKEHVRRHAERQEALETQLVMSCLCPETCLTECIN